MKLLFPLLLLLSASLLHAKEQEEITDGHVTYMTLETDGDEDWRGILLLSGGKNQDFRFNLTPKSKIRIDGQASTVLDLFRLISRASDRCVVVRIGHEKDRSGVRELHVLRLENRQKR